MRDFHQDLAPRSFGHRLSGNYGFHGGRYTSRTAHALGKPFEVYVFVAVREPFGGLCSAYPGNFIIGQEVHDAVTEFVCFALSIRHELFQA